jgi:hypothetical protein
MFSCAGGKHGHALSPRICLARGGQVSAKAVAWAWTQKVFPSATVLLQCLADEADDQGNCGVNDVSTLARKCAVSERTIHRDLEFLEFTIRIFIDRRWSPEGLQLRSGYVLNLSRPSDTQNTFRRPKDLRKCSKDGTDSLAVRGDKPAGWPVKLAELSPRSAMLAGHGTARLSGRESSSCGNQSERSANLADKKQHTEVVVVSINTTTTVNGGDREQLIRRLQAEMCLDAGQAQRVCLEYPETHLIAVIDYASERYRAGKVRTGKIAPYFLHTVKQASPESLGLKRSTLDTSPPAPAQTERQIAAEVAATAERDEARKAMREAEEAWNALDAARQETLRTEFMAHLAEDNHVVYDALRREKNLTRGSGYRLFLVWFLSRLKDRIKVAGGEPAHG